MDKKDPNSVTLDTPIQRGETTIDSIVLRKPKSGALRGTKLDDVLHMDVNALMMVVPRISTPPLTAQEVADMDPADLMKVGIKVALFLAPKQDLETLFQTQ